LEFIKNQMKKKAIIVSLKGFNLSTNEKNLIKNEKPWGVILFRRNIKSYKQVKNLTKNIRLASCDKNFPILIDEEGKTVSRLKGLIDNNLTQKIFGDIFEKDPLNGFNIYKIYINRLTNFFKKIGININTVPVLDVIRDKKNKIIGERSFSKNQKIVKRLGQICVHQYKKNKIGTVIKHIPGHGCTPIDTHLKMPKVSLDLKELKKIDFYPFKSNKSFFAMTAHILYSQIDKRHVATFSKEIISKIIRKQIGFKGILISDDISMKSLKYDLLTNAQKSLIAGCNLVLYCAGNYKDSLKLIRNIPFIDKFTAKKTSEFYKFLR
tara:strand:- start:10211 stop:11176 length:966 start_codon:yes stop_codon:yes gene_type:complete